MSSSGYESKSDLSNSLFTTTKSILDRKRVNSEYRFRIIFTNALTDTPILSDSSSSTLDNSMSTRNDLVVELGTIFVITTSKINVLVCNQMCSLAMDC